METSEKKAKYEILREGHYSDYVIIDRKTEYCPFVVCYAFDKETYSWAQGHYHNDFDSALYDFYEREKAGIEYCLERLEETLEGKGE